MKMLTKTATGNNNRIEHKPTIQETLKPVEKAITSKFTLPRGCH